MLNKLFSQLHINDRLFWFHSLPHKVTPDKIEGCKALKYGVEANEYRNKRHKLCYDIPLRSGFGR